MRPFLWSSASGRKVTLFALLAIAFLPPHRSLDPRSMAEEPVPGRELVGVVRNESDGASAGASDRLRPLEGAVVDRQGRPVAGARVVRADSQVLRRTTTDAAGRFRLDFDVAGFLFVETDGFRFHGQVSDGTRPVRVTLTRVEEAVPGEMKTLPRQLSKEERRSLAEKLVAPLLSQSLEKEKDEDRLDALRWLAGLDPARALEVLEKKPLKSEWFDGYVRRAVAKRLLRDSPEEARAVVEAIRDPKFRVAGYLDLHDAVPDSQPGERRQLLGQALLHARAVKEADHRVINLACVADRLLALGEKEQAAKILREGLEATRNLPVVGWSGYARGAFAESLALVDLPAALELTRGLTDPFEFDRHHGNMAHKLARTNPAEAERVWDLMRNQSHKDEYAMRLCYRLATRAPDQARSIARRVHDVTDRAQAYGAMARALAPTDKVQATALLRQAFATLAEQVATGQENYNNMNGSSSVAAMLVPVAEQIDPALVPEFFWRAVSFRVPRSEEAPGRGPSKGWMADSALAYALARYDRKVAALLLDEATPMLLKNLQEGGSHLVEAMTLVDLPRARRLVEDMKIKDYRLQKIAALLLRDGDALWRQVHRDLGLWWADTEDLADE